MLFNTKKWSLAGLLILTSSVACASTSTIGFGSVNDAGTTFNQFSVTDAGVTVTVSGWSDTKTNPNNGLDNRIERAIDFDKNGSGWSMENADEATATGQVISGLCSNEHSADNKDCAGSDGQDYDFFMLAFTEEVSLTQATYSWVMGSTSNNQVSVVALDSTTVNNTLDNRSWNGVKNNHTLSSDYAQMQSSGGYFTSFGGSNVDGEFSTHWLIGALNSTFGGNASWEDNDGMKLSGVSFNKKPPTDIPEPNTLMLFGLAMMGFAASKRRKLK